MPETAASTRASTLASLRTLFVSGLLTLLPIWLTWVVFKFVFGMLSDLSRPLVGPALIGIAQDSPHLSWLASPLALTAVGMVATVVLILAVGLLARRVAGQRRAGQPDPTGIGHPPVSRHRGGGGLPHRRRPAAARHAL